MVKSEVIIDEKRCHGCGYCVAFCPRGCLEMSRDKTSRFGYTMPVLIKPEQCNTCGFCAQMCPHWAIEVYLTIEARGKAVAREKVAGQPRLAVTPPFANCSGCQRPTVGRIITEVLDELGIDGRAIAIDATSCGSASAFGPDFGVVPAPFERHTDIAIVTKRAHPDAIVFAVQDNGNFNITGIEPFVNALICAENITLINCNAADYGPWPKGWHAATANCWVNTPEGRELVAGKYPLHAAELAATFRGVAYSARGAITSPDDYQRTKSYIKIAFQKQINGAGLSFVEVLCACFPLTYDAPMDCLQWIKQNMIAEFPLGELKNVD